MPCGVSIRANSVVEAFRQSPAPGVWDTLPQSGAERIRDSDGVSLFPGPQRASVTSLGADRNPSYAIKETLVFSLSMEIHFNCKQRGWQRRLYESKPSSMAKRCAWYPGCGRRANATPVTEEILGRPTGRSIWAGGRRNSRNTHPVLQHFTARNGNAPWRARAAAL